MNPSNSDEAVLVETTILQNDFRTGTPKGHKPRRKSMACPQEDVTFGRQEDHISFFYKVHPRSLSYTTKYCPHFLIFLAI